jgi:hypothetical protein
MKHFSCGGARPCPLVQRLQYDLLYQPQKFNERIEYWWDNNCRGSTLWKTCSSTTLCTTDPTWIPWYWTWASTVRSWRLTYGTASMKDIFYRPSKVGNENVTLSLPTSVMWYYVLHRCLKHLWIHHTFSWQLYRRRGPCVKRDVLYGDCGSHCMVDRESCDFLMKI